VLIALVRVAIQIQLLCTSNGRGPKITSRKNVGSMPDFSLGWGIWRRLPSLLPGKFTTLEQHPFGIACCKLKLSQMGSAPGRQCYVVISPSFEGADARPSKWLGRLASLAESPSAAFAPFETELKPTLEKFYLKPTHDTDAVVFANAIKNTSLTAKLLSIITLDRQTCQEKGLQIQSSKVATFSLQQYDKVLQSLLGVEGVKNEVLDLLRKSKRKAYMIVGVKILYAGIINTNTSDMKSSNVELTLPVAEAALLAAGTPIPLMGKGDASGKKGQQQASNTGTHFAFVKPRIFALEYREVNFRKSLIRRLSEDPSISLQTPSYRFNAQVFGAEDGAEDSDGGDDESDKEDGEVDETHIHLRESPLDLTDVNGGLGFQTSAFGGGEKGEGKKEEEEEEGKKSDNEYGVFIHQDTENEPATN
jgi:hypothetical protein